MKKYKVRLSDGAVTIIQTVMAATETDAKTEAKKYFPAFWAVTGCKEITISGMPDFY